MQAVRHVICAMSGIVDSSSSSTTDQTKRYFKKERYASVLGYQVTGVFMKNWDSLDEHGVCTSEKDCEDAYKVCHVGYPLSPRLLCQRVLARSFQSMEINFIGERHFEKFILEYLDPHLENFVSVEDGKVMGTHKGWFTLGQRIGGQKDAWFVVDKDIQVMSLWHRLQITQLCSETTLRTDRFLWIAEEPPAELIKNKMMECNFHFLHQMPLEPCTVTLNMDGLVWVTLAKPGRALTPGQGDECLGSRKIIHLGPLMYTLHQGQERMKVAETAPAKTDHSSKPAR